MKLLFIADARSPIARNWIEHFVRQGHEIHIVSSHPCPEAEWQGVRVYFIPLGLNRWSDHKPRLAKSASVVVTRRRRLWYAIVSQVARLAKKFQNSFIGSFSAVYQGANLRRLLQQIQPDLVHAMRIPYEGVLAAAVPPDYPVLISVWGNDFTMCAARHPVTGYVTRRALRRADGLHTDCQRDQTLAMQWGFDPHKPSIVLPGAGGIQTDVFFFGEPAAEWQQRLGLSDDARVVINPRGLRGYVHNDVFFHAIPRVVRECPQAVFLCSAMQGEPVVERWIDQLGIAQNVRLLPLLPRQEMAAVFRLAQVSVSPSAHDGTPNTLLEAMASGCFPIAADIESVREWIDNGVNGLLYDLLDVDALARAILQGLADADLRSRAREFNARLIAERAEYRQVMAQAEQFYRQVIEQAGNHHA